MTDLLRGRLPLLGLALTAALVGAVLLAPTHPESGLLHLLSRMLPAGALAGGSAGWWAFEDAGNIALFVPVGLIAARFLRPVHAVLAGAAVSALGELAQLAIPARHASVQDVLMNTVGVAIGVVAMAAIRRFGAWRRQASATRPHSVQAQ